MQNIIEITKKFTNKRKYNECLISNKYCYIGSVRLKRPICLSDPFVFPLALCVNYLTYLITYIYI